VTLATYTAIRVYACECVQVTLGSWHGMDPQQPSVGRY